jgi:capsular exopolysaccharide synthesis family protein
MSSEATPARTSVESSTASQVDYLGLILRHLWLTVGVVAIAMLGTFLYLRTLSPQYRSTALLDLDIEAPNVLGSLSAGLETQVGGRGARELRMNFESQYRVISGRAVAEDVANRLALRENADFLGLSDVKDPAALRAALGRADAAAVVMGAITIEPVFESSLVRIHARASSPKLATQIANTVAEVYIGQRVKRRLDVSESSAAWLRQQYEDLGKQLSVSESAVYDFRKERNILSISLGDRQNLTGEALGELSGQLFQAESDARGLRVAAEQHRLVKSDEALLDAAVQGVISSELIEGLKVRLVDLSVERTKLEATYLDGHPQLASIKEQYAEVRSMLLREVRNSIRAVEAQLAQADKRVGELRARLDQTRSEALAMGQDELTYNNLVSAAASDRELYRMIERRLKEVEIARMLQQNRVAVVERANDSGVPVYPKFGFSMLASFVVGVLLALVLAYLVEVLDTSVRSVGELERLIGVTALGFLPNILRGTGDRRSSRAPAKGEDFERDTFVIDYPKSTMAESCRSIRTNLIFMGSEQPLRSILVTSAGPREGKTTASVSLAAVMAQSGSTVVLVDGDMRKPRLHKVFGLDGTLGLSSVLMGEASLDEVIQATRVPDLFIIPCGIVPENPAELLQSDRFRELIAELTERFGMVVFDSPPVVPVTDAAIIGSAVDGVVLVARSGATRREMIARAVDLLRGVNANLLGVVLNAIDVEGRRRGGYYYYYYRHYGEYYGQADDKAKGGDAAA